MQKKATLKGRGPELLGRGVDLLFGEEVPPKTRSVEIVAGEMVSEDAILETVLEAMLAQEVVSAVGAHESAPVSAAGTSRAPAGYNGSAAVVAPAGEAQAELEGPDPAVESDLELDVPPLPEVEAPEASPAAEAPGQAPEPSVVVETPEPPPLHESPEPSPVAEAPTMVEPSQPVPEVATPEPLPVTEAPEPPSLVEPSQPIPEVATPEPLPVAEVDTQPGPSAPVEASVPSTPPTEPPAMPAPSPSTETPSNGTTAAEVPPAVETQPPPQAETPVEPRKVGAPGVVVGGSPDGTDADEYAKFLERVKETISREEAEEIQSRIKDADLKRLDREIDELYKQTVATLSGEAEAQAAFEGLRRARMMLLMEPEQYAEIEYLVNQIRAIITRVEQSAEWGPHYGPRILTYEVLWLAFLGFFAVITLIPNTGLSRWIAYLLGSGTATAELNWVMMLISTVCWGGIGGVTGALWSLHYHVSVRRDYDRAENLWYFVQPLMGMVLGAMIYLIIGAGFLVVQVDLSAPDAAFGARLLPATIALVVGFRQNVVLDMIDRIVNVLTPGPATGEVPPPGA